MQKGFSGILVIVIVALLAVGGYMYSQSTNYKQSPVTSSVIHTPAPSPSMVDTYQKESLQKYTSGEEIAGLSITYPDGWMVTYRKVYNLGSDYTGKYAIVFDFAPKGWDNPPGYKDFFSKGWGQMSFFVYDPQINIDEWMNKNVSEKYRAGLLVTSDTRISNKPTFLVSSDQKTESTIGWYERDIILGKDYSYEVGFSQFGVREPGNNFVQILKKQIYPGIHIN